MRMLVQRVTEARVRIKGEVAGEIGPGMLLLVGVTHADTMAEVELLVRKVSNLRIFDDPDGNLNLSALDVHAEQAGALGVLVVSQFTLYADARRGRRPSFTEAAAPPLAAPLVNAVISGFQELGLPVAAGVFGAEMAVELTNDGPVTIWLDTVELRK